MASPVRPVGSLCLQLDRAVAEERGERGVGREGLAEERVAETARQTPASPAMTETNSKAMAAVPPARLRRAGIARAGRVCRSLLTHRAATTARRFAMGRALAVIAYPLTWRAISAKTAVDRHATRALIARQRFVSQVFAARRMVSPALIQSSAHQIIVLANFAPNVLKATSARAVRAIR